jgi:hypothetical protein
MESTFRKYLFERHSEAEIKSWANRLNYFRYFRAYGGHANDGDSLDLAIRYSNTKEILSIFDLLGVETQVFEEQPPQPVTGKSYTGVEFECFPSLIKNTEWIKQPGWIKFADLPAFVWAYEDRVIVTAGPSGYEVNEDRVECAERIEASVNFSQIQSQIIDPPKDTRHYVSPVHYPDFF